MVRIVFPLIVILVSACASYILRTMHLEVWVRLNAGSRDFEPQKKAATIILDIGLRKSI